MAHKDALTIYEELIAGGEEDKLAKIKAHQYGDLSDYLGCALTKFEETLEKMDKRLTKIDKDMWWMRAIGAGMIVACFSVMFRH